jgi:uncharacterized membrane protein YqjE
VATTTPGRGAAAGLGALLVRLLGEARQLVADYSLLAVLDARRAALTLAWLLSSGLVVAVLVVTAWLALVVAGMIWIAGSMLSWPAALAFGAALNVIGAVALLWWMRSLVIDMPFEALLRQLRGEDADVPPGPRD